MQRAVQMGSDIRYSGSAYSWDMSGVLCTMVCDYGGDLSPSGGRNLKMAYHDYLELAFAGLEWGLGRELDEAAGVVGSRLVEVEVGSCLYDEPSAARGIERPKIRFRHGKGRRGQRQSQDG